MPSSPRVRSAIWAWGSSRADEIGRKVEEKVRKAQRRAEEREALVVPKQGPVVGPTGDEGAPPDPNPERLGGGL